MLFDCVILFYSLSICISLLLLFLTINLLSIFPRTTLHYTTSLSKEEEPDLIDDDDVIKFRWDGKGRFMDLPKLTSTLEEARAAEESMSGYRER